jgi:hypothetical protein
MEFLNVWLSHHSYRHNYKDNTKDAGNRAGANRPIEHDGRAGIHESRVYEPMDNEMEWHYTIKANIQAIEELSGFILIA